MGEPFISVDKRRILKSIRETVKGLRLLEDRFDIALKRAVVEYAEDTMGEAAMRAPVDTGTLSGSGTVDGPHDDAEGFKVNVAFGGPAKDYAPIQDLGGTITATPGKSLFVPLRKGVRPGEPGLTWGEDFVLTKSVTIKGNRYLTGLIPSRQRAASSAVGRRVLELIRGGRR